VTRICTRCGAASPRIEADHPDGRTRPGWLRRRAAVPVYPEATADLCATCHVGKGMVDRSAGIEGADGLTLWLLVRRRASWAGWFALTHGVLALRPAHLADLARAMEDAANAMATCSIVLVDVAAELHRRGIHDLAATVEGVAVLLGRPPR
jgi:hypothetical protein